VVAREDILTNAQRTLLMETINKSNKKMCEKNVSRWEEVPRGVVVVVVVVVVGVGVGLLVLGIIEAQAFSESAGCVMVAQF
jgi:hypothetical protein